jgi:ankyrin repeat protein
MAHGLARLHIAVILGRTRRVIDILSNNDKGTVIDAGDRDGTTPLMTAVLTGRLSIARLLLRSGASHRVRDRRGHTALSYSRASLFKKRLQKYRSMGLPPVSEKQRRRRIRIAKILRYPAALESWYVCRPIWSLVPE